MAAAESDSNDDSPIVVVLTSVGDRTAQRDTTSSLVTVINWNDQRRTLHELLCGLHADLGALYRYAIDIAAQPARPAEERAQRALFGHCMRELMNNLPEAFKDVPNMPVRGQHNDADVAERLVNSYTALEFGELGETASSREPLVTVPYSLIRAVKDFVSDYDAGTSRRKLRDSASVLGRLDENDPTLALWTAARKFFMGLTHVGPRATESLPQRQPIAPDDLVLKHLECVEAALMTRLGNFFDNMHAIEDLVAEANKPASGVGE